jgi:hypothetical protein
MIVYSGLREHPHPEGKNSRDSFFIKNPRFKSASHSYYAATNFSESGHILKIHIPKGSRGFNTAAYSAASEEDEYTLANNHELKISGSPSYDKTYKRYVWHAKLIHDGFEKTSYHPDKNTDKNTPNPLQSKKSSLLTKLTK